MNFSISHVRYGKQTSDLDITLSDVLSLCEAAETIKFSLDKGDVNATKETIEARDVASLLPVILAGDGTLMFYNEGHRYAGQVMSKSDTGDRIDFVGTPEVLRMM